MNIEPDIHHDVRFDEYAAWPFWNPSTIKVMLSDSARAMNHTLKNGRPSSDAMDLGRAEHCCVLEPFRMSDTYAIMPHYERDDENVTAAGHKSTSRATAYYKAKSAEFAAKHGDREIIEEDDYRRCVAMRDAIMAHESAPALFEGLGRAEASIVWDDPETGLRCKGRIDWLQIELRRLTDLKTAANPQPWAFSQQVAKLHYHVSMGAYVDGLSVLGYPMESVHFVVVGNKPWHDVIRYDCEPSLIRHGRKQWHSALQRVRWCIKNNQWPGFCAEPFPLELPSWAVPDDEAVAMSISDEAA